jgi:endothelin-converting enzyme/putative endopeptidase
MKKSAAFLLLTTLILAALYVAAETNETIPQHGIAVANMNQSVRPGDDFFEYANGTWLKNTAIPADRPLVSPFYTLFDLATERTQKLIEEVANANPPSGTERRKIADLYHAFMDEAGIEAKGTAPLKPQLDAIAAIKNKKQLARALGQSLRADVDALNNAVFQTPNLFGLWVAPNFNDPEHYIGYLMQGGITLPDREYYLQDNAQMKEVRTKYQAHVEDMLKLAGFNDAATHAGRIVDLERQIAEKQLSLADSEDIHKANNPWTPADFIAKAPGLDWAEFFRGAGLDKQRQFIVWQPSAFAGESELVASAPLDTWKDWLAYHTIEAYSFALPKAFAEERFNFFGKVLNGTPQQQPRWRRAVNVVNGELGDAVGKIYAQKYFGPEAKSEAEAMVANIKKAFENRIDSLEWMAPQTKAEAKNKLAKLYVGVGYPETWEDYSGLEIKPDDAYGNAFRGDVFEYRRHVNRLGGQIDRHEWSMTPQTVNAVNLPLQNALNFPAAILQPPFYDPNAPAAANYGAIGSVIGHEISHTFDSEGAAFDAEGRVRNWWTPEDFAHFKSESQRLVDQYSSYKPFPDLAVNGRQTLGENIADLGGISASLDGYHASLAGKEAPVQDGFTGDQQFFIAYAQNWAQKMREEVYRQRVLADGHAPDPYRACEVRNLDLWYSVFDVKPGERLYLEPKERIRIW